MEDLKITVNTPWFSQNQIEEIDNYTKRTFGVCLKTRLEYVCCEWLGKAQDQVHEQGPVTTPQYSRGK